MATVAFPETLSMADYFLFDRLKEGLGEKVAVRFGNRRYTYREVADRAEAVARYLRHVGVAREERVYVVLPDAPPFVWGLFGVLAGGAVLAMGNPNAPSADLDGALSYIRATALITTPGVVASLSTSLAKNPHLRAVLTVPDVATGDDPEGPCEVADAGGVSVTELTAAIKCGQELDVPLPCIHRDDPSVWLFTSGSTGRPKAAMHTHRDFAYNTEVFAKSTVGYQRDDVTVSVPRLFFGYATGTNLWFPFAVGATVGLFAERPTADTVAHAIATYRPTVVTNVPTMMGRLLDKDSDLREQGGAGLDMSAVRFHLSAGEALPPALLARFTERFGCAVYDGIGSAEMFHIYASNRPGDVKPGSLGRPVEGYEVRILPRDAAGPGAGEVAVGDVGVLWVRGDSVALGYFQDRDKSFQTFHGHWCRTGDLFRRDEDGYLWFAGRADDLFKVGGVFVAPREVEDCLLSHPAISAVAVVPWQKDELIKPKAFVVVRPEERGRICDDAGQLELAAELQNHVKTMLSKHKYPRWVVFLDELPKNDRGKVDRRALSQQE